MSYAPALPRNAGDDAKDVAATRPVIIEQDPLYPSYQAWGRALAEAKKKG